MRILSTVILVILLCFKATVFNKNNYERYYKFSRITTTTLRVEYFIFGLFNDDASI